MHYQLIHASVLRESLEECGKPKVVPIIIVGHASNNSICVMGEMLDCWSLNWTFYYQKVAA